MIDEASASHQSDEQFSYHFHQCIKTAEDKFMCSHLIRCFDIEGEFKKKRLCLC